MERFRLWLGSKLIVLGLRIAGFSSAKWQAFSMVGEWKPGHWFESCEQRAFVEGAAWWQWHQNGSTMFSSERDEAESEAVKRYGEPTPGKT